MADYTFTLHVRVHDYNAVLNAAREQARGEGIAASAVNNTATALQWLLDPGSLSFRGAEIQESVCTRDESLTLKVKP